MTERETVEANMAAIDETLDLFPYDTAQQVRRAASAAQGVAMSITPDPEMVTLCLSLALNATLLQQLGE